MPHRNKCSFVQEHILNDSCRLKQMGGRLKTLPVLHLCKYCTEASNTPEETNCASLSIGEQLVEKHGLCESFPKLIISPSPGSIVRLQDAFSGKKRFGAPSLVCYIFIPDTSEPDDNVVWTGTIVFNEKLSSKQGALLQVV